MSILARGSQHAHKSSINNTNDLKKAYDCVKALPGHCQLFLNGGESDKLLAVVNHSIQEIIESAAGGEL